MRAGRRLLAFAAAGSWPIAAQAQRLGGGGAPDVSIARVLAALAICLAAAFALALVVAGKRGGGAGRLRWPHGMVARERRVEVIEARRLSAFADLCLVRCDGAEYLLLCGQAGQTVLYRSAPGDGDAG